MDAQLIDKIYESCFAPETWPGVLDEVGRIADTTGATLIVSKDDVLRWVASPEPRERAEKFVKEGCGVLHRTVRGRNNLDCNCLTPGGFNYGLARCARALWELIFACRPGSRFSLVTWQSQRQTKQKTSQD